jgi:hypothetical protein
VSRQFRELFDDRGLLRTFRADQDAMPLPPAGPGWFDQDHHHAAEQVHGQSTEHPFRKKAGVVFENLKDPLVVERSHPRFPLGPSESRRWRAHSNVTDRVAPGTEARSLKRRYSARLYGGIITFKMSIRIEETGKCE